MDYKKGDIVIINFPFTDLTSTKKRPALIISNDVVNQTSDYLLVQITSKLGMITLHYQFNLRISIKINRSR